jgi:hypothetical protein
MPVASKSISYSTALTKEVLDFSEFLKQKIYSISEVAPPVTETSPITLTGLRRIATRTSTPSTEREIEEDYTNCLQQKCQ